GCSSTSMRAWMGGASSTLYQQLGGMDSMTKLAGGMVRSSMTDPRLSGLLANVNPSSATPRLANQLCAALGGGCTAPFTPQQIDRAAERLTPEQRSALSENFNSSLNSVTTNSALQDSV